MSKIKKTHKTTKLEANQSLNAMDLETAKEFYVDNKNLMKKNNKEKLKEK